MEGIKIALMRFFKNKNTVTIIAIILCLFVMYGAYYYQIKTKTDPVDVPYSLNTIGSKTLITGDMIGTTKVPKSNVKVGVITNSDLIIDKYVAADVVIPEGSLFYERYLVDWKDLPTSLYADIPQGYTVVYLPVDMEMTYGNSIFPGNYIDLYYYTLTEDSKIMLGKLIESIEVLAVVDYSGNSVFSSVGDEKKIPAFLMFAVDEEYHLLLRKAMYLSGTLFPVPRNAQYSKNPEKTAISSTQLKDYILSQTINVAEEDLALSQTSVKDKIKKEDITKNEKLPKSDEETGGND